MSYYTAKQNHLLSAISGPVPCLLLVPSARNYLQLLSHHETRADYVQKPNSEQEAACLQCPNKADGNTALGKNTSADRQSRAINFSPRQAYRWPSEATAVPRRIGASTQHLLRLRWGRRMRERVSLTASLPSACPQGPEVFW